jgi:hypothetical protein
VLAAREALLLGGRDDLAADDKGSRRIVEYGVYAEDTGRQRDLRCSR